jgi:hypothetical protein
MTREELKAHCERQIEMCEMWAMGKNEKPSGKIYEEHKLILELLEQAVKAESVLDKIREQIKSDLRGVEITLEVLAENDPLIPKMEGAKDTLENCLEIIDKAESEKQE